MILTFEKFTASLFLHYCCLSVWSSASPAFYSYLKTSGNNSLFQTAHLRTSPEETDSRYSYDIQNFVELQRLEIPQIYLDEDFLEGNDTASVHIDLNSRQLVKRQTPMYVHVPQYMMDIYTHLQDKKWIPKFDVARSFHSIRTDLKAHRDGQMNEIRRIDVATDASYNLYFNITNFPKTEKIELAQLRLFATDDEGTVYNFGKKNRIKIFWIQSKDNDHLIASREIENQEQSKITFNITQTIYSWMRDSESQQLLKVLVENPDFQTPAGKHTTTLVQTGIGEEPQILVFSSITDHSDDKDGDSLIRRRRTVELVPESLSSESNPSVGGHWEPEWNGLIGHAIRKRSDDDDELVTNYIVEELGRVRKGRMKKTKNPCRRRPLYVNFASINYDQWIKAPPGYEAFKCTGKCHFPMRDHWTPTKHAIIQTLIHGLESKNVSRACCVPTKLTSISMLYIDENNVITYKYAYEDMVAAECGCR